MLQYVCSKERKDLRKYYRISIKKMREDNVTFYGLEKKHGLKRNVLYSAFHGRKKISNKSMYFDILEKYLEEYKED